MPLKLQPDPYPTLCFLVYLFLPFFLGLSLSCTQCARLGFCQLQRCGLTYRPTGPWIDVWMLLLHSPLYSLAVFALSICAFSAQSCSLFPFRLGSGNNSGARQAPPWPSQVQNALLNSLTSLETKETNTERKWESCMGMRLCPTKKYSKWFWAISACLRPAHPFMLPRPLHEEGWARTHQQTNGGGNGRRTDGRTRPTCSDMASTWHGMGTTTSPRSNEETNDSSASFTIQHALSNQKRQESLGPPTACMTRPKKAASTAPPGRRAGTFSVERSRDQKTMPTSPTSRIPTKRFSSPRLPPKALALFRSVHQPSAARCTPDWYTSAITP